MTQLYLISPPQIRLESFLPELDAALSAGLVSVFQLRLKDLEESQMAAHIPPVLEICRAHGVPMIVNDHVQLAARFDCEGVHVGQKDMSVREARQILGPDKTVGATCHDSRHLAMLAAEAGADYVAFGAFYPTKTKDYGFRPKPDLLRDWSDMTTVPCVAIGGITPENCAPLVEAGADFIAVVSYVWEHKSGAKAGIEGFRPFLSNNTLRK